jgi:hypothetical protein
MSTIEGGAVALLFFFKNGEQFGMVTHLCDT